MLLIAFLILAVLIVLFGSCVYIYIKNNRNDAVLPESESSLPAPQEPKGSAVTDAELLDLIPTEKPSHSVKAAKSEGQNLNLIPIIIVTAVVLVILSIVAVLMVLSEADKHSPSSVSVPQTVTATVDNLRLQTTLGGKMVCRSPEIAVFTVNGKITSVKVKEGDRVRQGDEIYTIDNSIVLEKIALLNKRIELLSSAQSISVGENTAVKATTGGRVEKLFVSVGSTVRENEPIAEISEATLCRVTLPFSADEAGGIRGGSKARVYADGKSYDATVISVNTLNDETVETTLAFTADTAPLAAEAEIGKAVSLSSGRVISDGNEHTVIYSDTDGKVTRINVKVGDKVKSGAALVLLTRENRTDEDKRRELEIEELKLELKELNDSLSGYTVTAPASGYVEKLFLKNGADAAVNVQAASIVPEGGLTLEVSMDKATAADFALPAAVDFTIIKTSYFPASVWDRLDTSKKFSGVMEAFSPDKNDPDRVSGIVKLEEQSLFRSGMSAEVNVTTYSKYDALLIPAELVKDGKVKIWRANKIKEVPVEVGITTENGYVEILSGITAVDKIVVKEGESD